MAETWSSRQVGSGVHVYELPDSSTPSDGEPKRVYPCRNYTVCHRMTPRPNSLCFQCMASTRASPANTTNDGGYTSFSDKGDVPINHLPGGYLCKYYNSYKGDPNKGCRYVDGRAARPYGLCYWCMVCTSLVKTKC